MLRILRPTLGDLIGIQILLLVVVAGGVRLFGDGDAATHVATGRWILEHRAIPASDPFAPPGTGSAWVAHEWLAAVGMAAIHDAFGWPGIVWLAGFLIAAAHVLLYRHLTARGDQPLVAFVAVEIAAIAASAHWLARPHLVTVLFLVIWTVLVEDVAAGRCRPRWLALLPPMAALWANLHAGFLVGLVVLALYGIGIAFAARPPRSGDVDRPAAAARARTLLPPFALAAILSAAATLINPWGFRLHGHFLEFLMRRGPALAYSSEFEPARLDDRAGLALLLLVLAAAAGVVAGMRRGAPGPPPFQPGTLLACAVTCAMAFRSIRHVEIAAIFAALVVSAGLSRWIVARAGPDLGTLFAAVRRHEAGAGGGLCVAALVATGLLAIQGPFPRAGFDAEHFPVAMVERLRGAGVRPAGPVFTPDTWGGYLTLEWPGVVVFADGRWDMRGDAAFERYVAILTARPGWDRLLREAGVEWALVPPDAPIAGAMRNDPRWRPWSADDAALVFRFEAP